MLHHHLVRLGLVAVLALAAVAPAAGQAPPATDLIATPYWTSSGANPGGVRLAWTYPDASLHLVDGWLVSFRSRTTTGAYPPGPSGSAQAGWGDWYDTGQPPTERAYVQDSLEGGKWYQFRIRVKRTGAGEQHGDPAYFDEVLVNSTPDLPPIAVLVATGGDGTVTLDWTAYPALATSDAIRWDWRRRVVGGAWGPFGIGDVVDSPDEACGEFYPRSLPKTARSIELRNVEAGTTYEYQLRVRRWFPAEEGPPARPITCDHAQVSPTSNPVTPTGSGSLNPPSIREVTSSRAGTLTVRWKPPNPPPYQYLVQWIVGRETGPDGPEAVWQDAGTPRGSTTEITISGLTDGNPYTVRVCSQGPDGTPDPGDPAEGENWRRYCAVAQGTAGLPNKPPELGDVTLEDLALTVNSAYVVSLVGVFTDPDGDTLTYHRAEQRPGRGVGL